MLVTLMVQTYGKDGQISCKWWVKCDGVSSKSTYHMMMYSTTACFHGSAMYITLQRCICLQFKEFKAFKMTVPLISQRLTVLWHQQSVFTDQHPYILKTNKTLRYIDSVENAKLRLDNYYKHGDVIKWNHFPLNWPFVRGIPRSPVNSPHKGLWRGALMFSLICVWINDWVNNREAGNLRRYRAYSDVIVMEKRRDF